MCQWSLDDCFVMTPRYYADIEPELNNIVTEGNRVSITTNQLRRYEGQETLKIDRARENIFPMPSRN